MSTQPDQMTNMKPYIIAAVALLILLLAVVFWPSGEDEVSDVVVEETTVPETVDLPESPAVEEEPTEEVYEPLPDTQAVVIDETPDTSPVELAPPVIEVEDDSQEPTKIDDETIKAALKEVIATPELMRFLVSDSLLQRFVINVNELASGETAPRNQLVTPPEEDFRVYQQAESTYIEPASFQRYTPYVEVLESVDVDEMTALLETFKPEIEKRFAEISRPGENFNQTLIAAIDVLLNTPQVPVPIEVYSDSVAYKFKDEQLENLPEPQKQLLRTGPENMRRIKDVLQEIKAELEKIVDFSQIQQQLSEVETSDNLPPVDKWDPPFCGDMPLVIKANGDWWHGGTPFTRAPLVKLFASVLKREDDRYFLVTPVEKIGIDVEDVPFVIVNSDWKDNQLQVTTQVGDRFVLNDEHPVELRTFGESRVPYVKVRRNLWARVHQNVLYRWVDDATEETADNLTRLYLTSGDRRILIGEFEPLK